MKICVKTIKNKNFNEDNALVPEPGNQYQLKKIREYQIRVYDKTFYIQVSKNDREIQST